MDRPGWVRYTQKRFGLIGRQTFYLVLSLRTLLLVLHEGPDISDPLIDACSHSRLSIFQSLAHTPYDMRAFAFALQEDQRNRRSGTRNEAS
jgi:hypothetical protein